MATQKQIAANRRNAQKSTGPKTPEGRAAVSRNAITHGLTAARAVVLPDEQEEFDQFSAAMYSEWLPQTPTERYHLDRWIGCAWRLKRMGALEIAVLLTPPPSNATGVTEDASTLGRAYIRWNRVLANLSRHERQLERSMQKAQYELELAQYTRATLSSPLYARRARFTMGRDEVEKEERNYRKVFGPDGYHPRRPAADPENRTPPPFPSPEDKF